MPAVSPTFPMMAGRWPILGHLPAIARDAPGALRAAADKLGPLFWVDAGFGVHMLMTLEDEGFEIFKNKGTDSSHLGDVVDLLRGSMLPLDGSEHRRVRGASSAPFTPGGLTQARVGEIIMEVLSRRLPSWTQGNKVSVLRETKVIALDIIFQVMGIESTQLREWARQYDEFVLGAINIPINLPGFPRWRARRGRAWLEGNLSSIIQGVRERGDRDSLVGALAHGRDEHGNGLTDDELRANLLILAFAGHETTASTMAWAMVHLAREPAAWRRLCDEATCVDELPRGFHELVKVVPYALAIFRESLRLYPPVNMDSRRAREGFTLYGREIPEGTTLGCSILHLSRNPSRYPQPEVWRPERWTEAAHKPTPIENCQFGGGPHFCLGYHMALLEGVLFLAETARAFARSGKTITAPPQLPRPSYLPLTRPPISTQIVVQG